MELVRGSLFLAVLFLLAVGFVEIEAKSKESSWAPGGSDLDSKSKSKSSSNFEKYKVSVLRCSETTMLCGLGSEYPLLGTDSLITTEGSRVRIKKFGRLEVKVEGVVPNKAYDVLFVYTPGGTLDCSSYDPSTCTADCTNPNSPAITCDFEPANCSADCADPENPVTSCNLDPANCAVSLTLVPVGSFTTDSKGKGKFQADVSSLISPLDSVHVLITDHDEDTTTIGDMPRQFITGAKVRK